MKKESKRVFVQPANVDISKKDLDEFYNKICERDYSNLILPDKISDNWQEFIENPEVEPIYVSKFEEINEGRHYLPRGKPKGNLAGVYGIFTDKNNVKQSCFYVGMSTVNARGRIRTHLGKDINKNYRKVFEKIEDNDTIYVCYAVFPKEKKTNKVLLKIKLELLEGFLTSMLSPEFLKLASI